MKYFGTTNNNNDLVQSAKSTQLAQTVVATASGDTGTLQTKLNLAAGSIIKQGASIGTVAAVTKNDITALGIPAQDTTYSVATTSASGLVPALPDTSASTKLLNGAGAWTTNITTSLTSDSTTDVLAASAGKTLSQRIDNIGTVGRYLSTWNCTTGKPFTEPASTPYAYRAGDYYVVGKTGTTNYKPSGDSYTGTASTVVESSTVGINYVYYFDGTTWTLSGGSVIKYDDEFSLTSENAVQNKVLTAAFHTKISDAGTGLVKDGTTIKHSNSIDMGSAGEYGTTRTLSWGDTFGVIYLSWDETGHVTNALTRNLTLPSNPVTKPYHVGSSAPSDTNLLWIDTTTTTGGLKYYNGSSWVVVPVAYS